MSKFRLREAIWRRDVSAVQHLLWTEMHPHSELLLDALKYANVNIIKMLLDHGYDVNFKDREGTTALHLACEYLEVEAATMLLNYGAKPNTVTNEGHEPIHKLAFSLPSWCPGLLNYPSGSEHEVLSGPADTLDKIYKILVQLFQFGLVLTATKQSHRSVVKKFIPNASRKILLLFAESGYDLKFVDRANGFTTLLHFAAQLGNAEATEELIRHIDINSNSDIGTPIILAASYGWVECAKVLVKHGCDISIISHLTGDSALCKTLLSYKKGTDKTLEILINGRSGINNLASSNARFFSVLLLYDTLANFSTKKLVIFAKHFIKMKLANFEANEKLISMLMEKPEVWEQITLVNFESECMSEIAQLQRHKVCGNVSMYDLMKKHESFTCWIMNEGVVHYFETGTHESQFPYYYDALYIAFKIAFNRRKMIEQAEYKFTFFYRRSDIPYTVIRLIINYLSNNDLQYLAKL